MSGVSGPQPGTDTTVAARPGAPERSPLMSSPDLKVADLGLAEFEDFAQMAATEILVIDEHTTVREFTREVRWNQAYYRLAQGL